LSGVAESQNQALGAPAFSAGGAEARFAWPQPAVDRGGFSNRIGPTTDQNKGMQGRRSHMAITTRPLVTLFLAVGIAGVAVGQDGTLTPQMIETLRDGLRTDAHTRAMQNALTGTSIRDIAENRQVLADHNAKFSHKIKTKGISNQKSSGRCWMFAGFNTIKPVILAELDLDAFEFSHIYLQFWDKLEKANRFLEYMIEFRDRDLLDRDVVFLLKAPAPDGGYWENFANLVAKYGVIPKEAMAETASSESTGMMNKALARILRKDTVELRRIYADTSSVEKMRQAKERMLAEVYRVLVLNLGEPPTQFTWRYKVKDDAEEDEADDEEDEDESESNDEEDDEDEVDDEEDEGDEEDDEDGDEDDYDVEQKWSERRTFTPRSFYEEFIGLDLNEYVNVTDDPIRPKDGHYEIDLTKNLWDGQNAHYANVSLETLREIVVEVLLDNRAVYFAADVSPDQDSSKGIMARKLYDYESVYDLDMGLNKTERLLFRDSTINHGMAFIGVDLRDGEPVKWLVENSWGSDRGRSGLWTMYDDWFEDNVYNIIVHRDDVPDDILEILERPATRLPVWDPMW
jgi:bleomycin hydrolase